MSKFILFSLLWWITGSPIVALLVILVIIYFLDRRFVGLLPSVTRPFRLNRRLNRLKQELRLNPHNTSNKLELARLLIEKKRYQQALSILQDVHQVMNDSAEVKYELGHCMLKLGQLSEGERLISEALEINPRIKYGEPYLRLGETLAASNADKALGYLKKFRTLHSSSCEAYYRLGQLYQHFGKDSQAREAFSEAVAVYRSLPKYKKRAERRWALLARLKGGK